MDAAVDIGSNPASKHHIQPECGDGTAKSVLRNRILRREREQGNFSLFS